MRDGRIQRDQITDQRHYARVEWVILDLQLGIASVRRANGCLDLGTVQQRTRARAAETLRNIDLILAQVRAEPSQAQRIAERRRSLDTLLRELAPIERLARTLRVG